MPPQNISVKGVIAGLNQAESLKQLQEDLNNIQDKLKLQISNININNDIVGVLQKISDGLDKITQSSNETSSSFINMIKSVKTVGNEIQLIGNNGEIWTKQVQGLKSVQDQAISAEQAVNAFKASIADSFNGAQIQNVTSKYVDGQLAGLQASIKNGLDTQKVFGNQFGQITANNETEQIAKQQEAFSKANTMFEQYINTIDELSQRGIVSQQDLLKAEDLVWSQFASIAEGTTKSITPVKQAFDDLVSTQNAAIAQVEKGDAQLTALMDKIVGLKGNRTVDSGAINSMESSALSLFGSGDLNAIKNIETEMARYQDQMNIVQLQAKAKAENDQKDFAAQQKAIKDEEALRKQDLADFQGSINEKIKVIKTLQQTQVISAQDALNQLRTLYTQNVGDVRLSTNQELDIVKAMYAQEENIAKQSAEKQASTMKNAFSPMNHTGFGMGPLGMAGTMVSFEASLAVLDNFKQGLVDVQQGSAGIQQVFANQISSQQQLNDITNQFITIAQKYGASITDVTNAAKLWGRQYKDVNEALVLTNNSTLLSIVDNLDVASSNRAVESSMNAMNMSVNNVGEAYANSMKLVDSWSAVSHEASVSASDLTQGFERSAAAARVAGLSVDQLSALVAASVRNTGRSGAAMGNMWKSVLSNIDSMTPKVQDAFKQLGISLTQVGANGQQEMKPMWDILNELAQVTEHANSSQVKYLTTIAGGKYQYDSMIASLSNTKTLTAAYQDSLTSQGKAAELAAAQMNTVHAQLQRLADDIQKFAYNTGNGGLTTVFTTLLKGAADLFEGLQKINPIVLGTVAGLLGVVPVTNAIVKSFKGMSDGISNFLNVLNSARSRTVAYFTETAAQSATSSATTVASTLAENAAKSKLVQTENELMLTTRSGLLVKASDVEAMDAQTVATLGLSEAEVTAGDTTKGLISLFGILDISSGGLLGILGLVAGGVAAYAIASGSSATATNQQSQSVNELTQAYDQNKSQVDSLLSSYSQLEKATNNGTVFRDSQQEQQYYDVMSKLANLLPNVTTYVDANGRAHIKTAQAIEDEIKAQQQLIQDQAKATADNFIASYQKQIDSISKATNQIRVLKNEMDVVNKTHIIQGLSTDTPQGQKLIQQLQQQIDGLPVSIDNANQALQKLFSDTINASLKSQGTILSDSNQGLLNSIIGSVDWGKIQNDQQKIQQVMSQIEKSVTDVAQNGTTSYSQLDGTLQNLNKSGLLVSGSLNTLEKSFQQTSQTVANSTQDLQNWNTKAADIIKQNKLLDQAEADLNKTGRLSSGVLSDLIAKYPDLTNVVGQGSQAILDWIKNEKDSSAQTLITEEQKTQAVISQTEQRIAEINREIAAEENLLAVTAQMSQALMNQSSAFAAAGDMTNAMKAAQLANMPQTQINNDKSYAQYLQGIVDNASAKMKTLQTAIGAIQGVGAGIAGTGVPSSGRKKSSNPAGTVDPLTNFMDTHADPFTDQIAQQDAALKESQSIMALYDSTSQQYRAELQKQIEILKEKQNSVKGEINWTNQNISALEKLAASEGKTSQRDATIKEIDKEKTSVITLTGTYYDLQKQINDTNNTLTKDSQQAFFDKLNASVVKTTTTIDNLKSALDLMQNSGTGDSQQQLDVMNQLSNAYAQNLNQINNNIAALEHESTVLKENSDAWKQNQTELQSMQSQQVSTAQSMKSLEGQYMTDAINVMNQMKQSEVDALTAQEQGMQDTIKNLQDQGKQFDMSDWNSNLQDVSNTLNEIDSRFDASPFIDSTGTVRNNLSYYNSQLQEIANVANSMTSSSSTDENGLFGQIQNEVNYANQLKSQLDDVNVSIKQNTLAYKQQEDQLNEQIKTETQSYDDQIKALQQKSSILDQQFNQEDKLQQLEDEQTKLDQAMQDKKFSYIDSQGKEIFTFDQSTVNSIKQEQDKLLEQFQRQDIKDSIQAQIDALNTAKDQTTTTLQTQLDNMKNIHQAELQSQQDYASTLSGLLQGLNSDVQTKSQQLSQLFSDQKTAIDQSWTDMENAVKNGTLDISSVMSPNSLWYQNTIGTLKQLNVDVSAQISQLLSVFSQINSLNSLIAPVMTGLIPPSVPPVTGVAGGAYSATSSMPNNVTQNSNGTYSFVGASGQKNTVTQQQALQYGWISPSGSGGGGGGSVSSGGSSNVSSNASSSNNNSSSGSVTNLSGASDAQKENAFNNAINNGGSSVSENGRTTLYDKSGKAIATYHEGGIIGQVTSPMSDLVNKLFNTRPNEQIIKALVGEVMVPQDNIVKNFLPNMQALVGSVANSSAGQSTQITYDLHDFTVQSNDPTDFLNQINHLVVSERR